jgi:choline-sulfatase
MVDVMPTLLEMAGIRLPSDLPGQSLVGLLSGDGVAERAILSEYHGQGMVDGAFMIKKGDLKYSYYVGGYRPQLFNTAEDPGEFRDLASQPAYSDVVKDLHDELLSILDPAEVDRQAKRNQKKVGKSRAFRGPSQSIEKGWRTHGGD